jgi:hypothetical protein
MIRGRSADVTELEWSEEVGMFLKKGVNYE